MSLSSIALKNLKPKAKFYRVAIDSGLFLGINPSGTKVWLYRYTFGGKQSAPLKIGDFPTMSLHDARNKREKLEQSVKSGIDPRHEVKGFTFGEFAEIYFEKVVCIDRKNPRGIRRYLDRDILPALKNKLLTDITIPDIQAIVELKKAQGSDSVALELRNIVKRLFDYAISQQRVTFNPAMHLPTRYIFKDKSRERALTPAEIKIYLTGLYNSNATRRNKLALHLMLLCMTRKTETCKARWENIDLNKAEWIIPAADSKTESVHVVYLSSQAAIILTELKKLANDSSWVFPSVGDYSKPVEPTTLNHCLKIINFEIPHFTIHDQRRTASTLLHEAGFQSDVIEKALNHKISGVRGSL
jgi:integrase